MSCEEKIAVGRSVQVQAEIEAKNSHGKLSDKNALALTIR